MADIEFVEGEFGENFDIMLRNRSDSALADLTGYTAATFTLKTAISGGTTRLTKALTLPGGSIVRWAMASGDTNYNDAKFAQVELTGTGLNKKTFILSVLIEPKLNA